MKSLAILCEKSHIFLIILWLVNDVALKVYFPGIASGKISDLIGLYLSPFILTAIFSIFYKPKEESLIFKLTVAIIFIFFVAVNISQDYCNYIYELIDFGLKYRGFADLSDLYCLPIIILSFYKMNFSNKYSSFYYKNYFILFLAFFTFLNSPSPPSGRSDNTAILYLLNSAEDVILLTNPINGKKISSRENFQFNFIGRNNEDTPSSIEKLSYPSECNAINEVPILIESRNYNSDTFLKNKLFIQYRINIYKNKSNNINDFSIPCAKNECYLSNTAVDNSEYYWDVSLQYRYISNCKLYETFLKPKQKMENFNN